MALLALWLLARLRFTGESPPQAAVQPFLSQIAPRPAFVDLATEISRVQGRLRPALLAVETASAGGNGETSRPGYVAALRVGDAVAVALLPEGAAGQPRDVERFATDAASGLTVLEVGSAEQAMPLTAWSPPRPQDPRYLLATATYAGGVSLRPVFVAAMSPVSHPAWPGPLWKVAAGTNLEAGSFVFTTGGDFAGLVVDDAGGPIIAAGDVLQTQIDRLRGRTAGGRGELGIEIQPLSPPVALVTGASGGVIVSWVDPRGPAAGAIATGDVIEEADGERLTADLWQVRAARAAPGDAITLRVRRSGAMREVVLVAGAVEHTDLPTLGLTMRPVTGVGSEVVRVVPFSAAQRAGLEAGDVITMAGEAHAPTPAQVRGAYASSRSGQGVLLALARGATHLVVVLSP